MTHARQADEDKSAFLRGQIRDSGPREMCMYVDTCRFVEQDANSSHRGLSVSRTISSRNLMVIGTMLRQF